MSDSNYIRDGTTVTQSKRKICPSCGCDNIRPEDLYSCDRCHNIICFNCYCRLDLIKLCTNCFGMIHVNEEESSSCFEDNNEKLDFTKLKGE